MRAEGGGRSSLAERAWEGAFSMLWRFSPCRSVRADRQATMGKKMKTAHGTKGGARRFAAPHPRYSALCILPDGKVETRGQAEADGYTIGTLPASKPPAPLTPKPAPVAPPNAVAPAPSPALLAERARALRIIAITPTGAEAEAEKAIRSGASVADFEGALAGWAILDARRRAIGGK